MDTACERLGIETGVKEPAALRPRDVCSNGGFDVVARRSTKRRLEVFVIRRDQLLRVLAAGVEVVAAAWPAGRWTFLTFERLKRSVNKQSYLGGLLLSRCLTLKFPFSIFSSH